MASVDTILFFKTRIVGYWRETAGGLILSPTPVTHNLDNMSHTSSIFTVVSNAHCTTVTVQKVGNSSFFLRISYNVVQSEYRKMVL